MVPTNNEGWAFWVHSWGKGRTRIGDRQEEAQIKHEFDKLFVFCIVGLCVCSMCSNVSSAPVRMPDHPFCVGR